MERRKADRDGSRSGWHSNRVQFFFFATLAKPGRRRGEPRDRQVEPRCFRRRLVRSTIEATVPVEDPSAPPALKSRATTRPFCHRPIRASARTGFSEFPLSFDRNARKKNVTPLENVSWRILSAHALSLVHFRKTKEVKGAKRRETETFRGLRPNYSETRTERINCPFWFSSLSSRNSPLTRPKFISNNNLWVNCRNNVLWHLVN